MDNLKFVQAQAFTLAGAGCVIGDTSLILNSFKTIDGAQLTMTDFGNIGFLTLEPDNNTQEEQASFTGITVNSNSTVSLTGVKNVGFIAPYTQTSGVLKTHAGGIKVIISNTSGFYDSLTGKNNDETITGIYTFTQSPIVPTPISASGTSVASVDYVNGVAIAGGVKASTTVFGISELSVAPVMASVPIAVGDNDTRVPTVNTSTVTAGMVAALAGTSGTPAVGNKYVTDADTTGTGAIMRSSLLTYGSFFGDGVDGTVTFDGSTTILGMAPGSSIYTMTRDLYLDVATINNGVTIKTAGYRIFAKTSLTNNGTIQRNGNNGGNGTAGSGGAGTAGTALAAGSIYGGLAGTAGAAGYSGTNQAAGAVGPTGAAQTESIGVSGAAGGAGGNDGQGDNGGGGGPAGAVTASAQGIDLIYYAISLREIQGEATIKYIKGPSASGGGGGGGYHVSSANSSSGGGSGSSGGFVFIAAKSLINNGTISAIGGNGGNGADGGAVVSGGGGGGAGGSGGVIITITNSYTQAGTVSVAGGTHGNGGAAGASGTGGSNGSNGNTGSIYNFTV